MGRFSGIGNALKSLLKGSDEALDVATDASKGKGFFSTVGGALKSPLTWLIGGSAAAIGTAELGNTTLTEDDRREVEKAKETAQKDTAMLTQQALLEPMQGFNSFWDGAAGQFLLAIAQAIAPALGSKFENAVNQFVESTNLKIEANKAGILQLQEDTIETINQNVNANGVGGRGIVEGIVGKADSVFDQNGNTTAIFNPNSGAVTVDEVTVSTQELGRQPGLQFGLTGPK